jgi:hypothetical protein
MRFSRASVLNFVAIEQTAFGFLAKRVLLVLSDTDSISTAESCKCCRCHEVVLALASQRRDTKACAGQTRDT